MKINDFKVKEEENLRWLEMYYKTIVGFASFAEQHSEACDREWLCMFYGLEDLADTMKQDIEFRKKELSKE